MGNPAVDQQARDLLDDHGLVFDDDDDDPTPVVSRPVLLWALREVRAG